MAETGPDALSAHASSTRSPEPGPDALPWTSQDWHQEVRDWIHAAVESRGQTVVGPMSVVKEWALSCVIRVPTDAGAAFFKTSIDLPLFVNEARVTEGLARLAPELVPTPLAVDLDRDWLLLPDVGEPAGHEADVELRSAYLAAVAASQVRLAEDPDALLATGCIDRRGPVMAEHLLELVAAPETTAALSADDAATLRTAEAEILATIAELSAGPLPPSLLHGDLHGGNVSVAGHAAAVSQSVPPSVQFFDWTDAAVACPFFDPLDVFWAEDADAVEALTHAFLGQWRAAYAAADVDRSWELAKRVVGAYHGVSYLGILRGVPEADRDLFTGSFGFWLKHLVAASASR